LRALLLQAFYTVRSERQLMEQLNYNLLFRWFVGLSADDQVWNATVFCKNRDRLLDGDIAAKFFVSVLNLPQVRKLLSGEHFSVDGTLIEAWASMKSFVPAVGLVIMLAGSGAKAQVNLSEYADPEGFLDVQALTCAQLAGTWQDQADLLASWYSGWYNGLAKKHYMDIKKGREAEHELIVYCKANPQIKIIQAIDIVFKSMRERMGIKVQ